MKKGMLNLLIFWICSVSWGIAQSHEPLSDERFKILARAGVVESVNIKLNSFENRVSRTPVKASNALSFRLHFREPSKDSGPANAPSPAWTLEILDSSGRQVWSASSAEQGRDFWSNTISGNKATVILTTDQDDGPLPLVIDRVNKITPATKPQSTVGQNNLALLSNQNVDIKTWGRAVARLKFYSEDDGQAWFCSGFLISQDLLITNRHCIKTDREMRSAEALFDYNIPEMSEDAAPKSRFKELVISSCDYDFTILRLKSPVNPADRRPLALDSSLLTQKYNLIVIQHPGGDVKKVSIIGCIVKDSPIAGTSTNPTDFGHGCDTDDSSSGSPVQIFDPASPQRGKVIGIHHLGYNEDLTPPNSPNAFNRAVSIRQIIEYIRQNKPELLQELNFQ